MKVVIIGIGSVGYQVARQLVRDGMHVVIIDKDPLAVRYAADRLDCITVEGRGNNLNDLYTAKAGDADYILALTGSDEINMACCYLVDAEFPRPRKIIRIRNLDYASSQVIERSLKGISYVVHPPYEASRTIINSISHGATSEIMEFIGEEVQMRGIALDENTSFVGKTIEEFRTEKGLPFLIPLIQRNSKTLIPSGSEVFNVGDEVYGISTREVIDQIFNEGKKKTPRLKRVVILGGGEIGVAVAQSLLGQKSIKPTLLSRLFSAAKIPQYSIKFVEKDYVRCKKLINLFPKSMVINADITEEDFLEEERLNDADLMICTTENQELNIIVALYAKKVGIKRTIVLVKSVNYSKITNQFDIDVVVSTTNSLINVILRFIHGDNVGRIQSVGGGDIKMLELTVKGNSLALGKPLHEIKLPKGNLVTFIYREGEMLIPDGNTSFLNGDRIVVLTRDTDLEKVKKLFIKME